MAISRSAVVCCALAALTLIPALAGAQSSRDRSRTERRVSVLRFGSNHRDRTPDREVAMSVGALRVQDEDANLPMAALRADWRLRSWLRSEVGASYAIGTVDWNPGGVPTTQSRSLQLASATVGVRAELPSRLIRPYVGIAAGLVLRDEEFGSRTVRTTMAFPTGVRFVLSDRVSLRGEARFRFDQRRLGGESVIVEQTGGLSVAF